MDIEGRSLAGMQLKFLGGKGIVKNVWKRGLGVFRREGGKR